MKEVANLIKSSLTLYLKLDWSEAFTAKKQATLV